MHCGSELSPITLVHELGHVVEIGVGNARHVEHAVRARTAGDERAHFTALVRDEVRQIQKVVGLGLRALELCSRSVMPRAIALWPTYAGCGNHATAAGAAYAMAARISHGPIEPAWKTRSLVDTRMRV